MELNVACVLILSIEIILQRTLTIINNNFQDFIYPKSRREKLVFDSRPADDEMITNHLM